MSSRAIKPSERYGANYNDHVNDIKTLRNMGCLVQINLYSVEQESNDMIKKITNDLLGNHLVDFVGTDAHRTYHRPPEVSKGAETIVERYGIEYAESILYKNADEFLIKG